MEGSILGNIIAGALLLFLGGVVAFGGYRLFLVLLPIYGFFFGLSFGAHSVQALFGDGFLATTTSWVVGFFAGLLFGLLSYLFWVFAVALVAGSFGYGLVAAFFGLFDADLDVLVWIIGVLVGLVFAVGAVVLNLQKAVVIIATALLGAGAIVGTFLLLFTNSSAEVFADDWAQELINDHPLYLLIFAVVAAMGMVFQFMANRAYEIRPYNRWDDFTVTAGPSARPGSRRPWRQYDARSDAGVGVRREVVVGDMDDVELGPIDYIVVEWPADRQPTGEAFPLLVDLVDRGLIRVLDLAFVKKEMDGTIVGLDLQDFAADRDPQLTIFEGASSGLLGEDDRAEAGNAIEPGCSAALLVYENTWAAPFATALRKGGAQLVAGGRIPVNAIISALDELEGSQS
jgi:hypothetical protein